MRPLIFVPAAVLLLVLGACAPTMGPNRYAQDLRRLSDSCEARGGILIASGQQSGRPETDYLCRITNATRLPTGG